MSEYWVSKDRYYCKYCNVYIADDKPSRLHHETGLRHKGNYDRFITGIYKKGEREKKEKREEAEEIARMEAAAHAAMAADGHPVASTSALPPSTSSKKKPEAPPKPVDPFASYTTASDLGYEEDPVVVAARKEAELRANEGVIGTWEKVTKLPKGFEEVDPIKEGLRREREEWEREREERDKRRESAWLQEKKVDRGEEDEVAPVAGLFAGGGIQLKRKRVTLREEEEKREAEEAEQRRKKERERAERKAWKKEGKQTGWGEVDLKGEDQGDIDFGEPQGQVKDEDEGDTTGSVKAEEGVKAESGEQDVKPEVVAPTGGGFKKRKFGAGGKKVKVDI